MKKVLFVVAALVACSNTTVARADDGGGCDALQQLADYAWYQIELDADFGIFDQATWDRYGKANTAYNICVKGARLKNAACRFIKCDEE